MITLYQNNGNSQSVIPTLFPDRTSQVWKLDLSNFNKENRTVKIVWNFSEEAELIWVNQLVDLLVHEGIYIEELYIPYLPYARQDKAVDNNLTFAKSTFLKLLPSVNNITTLDIHSNLYHSVLSYNAFSYIQKAIIESGADVLVFPDAGAFDRYAPYLMKDKPIITLDKIRDQTTGNILGLSLNEDLSDMVWLNEQRFMSNVPNLLIVDDICDGGATFINAAVFLHEKLTCGVALYVTHGIFSKGFDKMIDAGISEFYTTQSLIKNTNGYKLEEI